MLSRFLIAAMFVVPFLAGPPARAGKCEDLYQKVNGLIEAGFKMKEQPVLPKSLEFSISAKKGELYFRAARKVWLKHWPDEGLLQELRSAYENGTPVAADTLKKVGAVRGRLKTVRFLCEAICENHESPHHLDKVTSVLGKLVDANQYSEDPAVKKMALEEVMELVTPASMQKVAEEITGMRPDHRVGNNQWFHKVMREVEEALAKPTLTENEFHEVRKNIGRIQTAILFAGMRKDDREKLEAVSWLSRLYMKLGGQHDEMIKQGYQTGKKPQENVIEADSRQWIEEVLEASRSARPLGKSEK